MEYSMKLKRVVLLGFHLGSEKPKFYDLIYVRMERED